MPKIEVRVKPGDYFSTSWGYDQTNIDFLVVEKVTTSGKSALCRRAAPIMLANEGTQNVITPGKAYGNLFRMKVREDGTLRGSYPYCRDESHKRLDTFLPTKFGEQHRETAFGFGH